MEKSFLMLQKPFVQYKNLTADNVKHYEPVDFNPSLWKNNQIKKTKEVLKLAVFLVVLLILVNIFNKGVS